MMDLREINKEYGRIYKEVEELFQKTALHLGLSESAFEIFYAICILGEGCTQKEMCDLCCAKKQTIHSSIQKMEKEGLILKKQGKGREVRIFLTDAGRQNGTAKVEPVVRCEQMVFAEMTVQERHEFLRLSNKYLDGLREKINNIL